MCQHITTALSRASTADTTRRSPHQSPLYYNFTGILSHLVPVEQKRTTKSLDASAPSTGKLCLTQLLIAASTLTDH